MSSEFVKFHKALGDDTRWRIVRELATYHLSGMELAERLRISPATVSFHLGKLRSAGIVTEERIGFERAFGLDRERLKGTGIASVQALLERERPAVPAVPDGDGYFRSDGTLREWPEDGRGQYAILWRIMEEWASGGSFSREELLERMRRYHPGAAQSMINTGIRYGMVCPWPGRYDVNPKSWWVRM
ncbi:metalloregulator ArsR/SmtB family transcription factor [Paenibacillus sp. TRM 82003]|nr:metalloregulator ArsR/SmtB family transcription factor [Paenibacillus sp. TRM 82003]